MNKHEHSFRNEKNYNRPEHLPPYWKRMHHDWRFWVGLVLIFTSLFIYIATEDFTIQPTSFK